ncbi:MAG: hypothetical protein AAGF12_33800, partial [Myxococcota bacterium]
DGFGEEGSTKKQCDRPIGYSANKLDQCPGVFGRDNGCEVNVTSPTGIQQISRLSGADCEAQVVRWLEAKAR